MGKWRTRSKLMVVVWLLAGAVLAAGPGLAEGCTENRVELRGPWGQAQFSVEIADSPEERAKGLMFRKSMPRSAGMLFRYESPQPASFWMKNTLIPLDMLFADETGRVRHIHAGAVPHDTTPIPGGAGILLVLEINGGLAKLMRISEGSELRTPLLDQGKALWPCSP